MWNYILLLWTFQIIFMVLFFLLHKILWFAWYSGYFYELCIFQITLMAFLIRLLLWTWCISVTFMAFLIIKLLPSTFFYISVYFYSFPDNKIAIMDLIYFSFLLCLSWKWNCFYQLFIFQFTFMAFLILKLLLSTFYISVYFYNFPDKKDYFCGVDIFQFTFMAFLIKRLLL